GFRVWRFRARRSEPSSGKNMANTPKVTQTPVARPGSKFDRISSILSNKLDNEPAILEMLVASIGKAPESGELWKQLHAAAVRDQRQNELATAYDRLANAPKLKALPAAVQAEVFVNAASFFEEQLNDAERSYGYLRRALSLAPGHVRAFEQVRT